jgi:hypothetical protein
VILLLHTSRVRSCISYSVSDIVTKFVAVKVKLKISDMRDTGQQILKWTVVGGSAVIAANAIMQLTKTTSIRGAVMPVITLLVGVSAFSYALTADKISFLPTVNE